jgi:hypothetical protein
MNNEALYRLGVSHAAAIRGGDTIGVILDEKNVWGALGKFSNELENDPVRVFDVGVERYDSAWPSVDLYAVIFVERPVGVTLYEAMPVTANWRWSNRLAFEIPIPFREDAVMIVGLSAREDGRSLLPSTRYGMTVTVRTMARRGILRAGSGFSR